MRTTFIYTLCEIAEKDPRIVFLTGDLGFMALEPFAQKFPRRFFNVGVAEQNMIGIATGLAQQGLIPFVYSIATFASMRGYEFIRNGPILHKLPVRIVGMGGGLEYGSGGLTHHAVEDVGILRIQPGIEIIVPADVNQAKLALEASWNYPGPIYYRLSKEEKRKLPALSKKCDLNKIKLLKTGKRILILTLGPMVFTALSAIENSPEISDQIGLGVVTSFNKKLKNDLSQLLTKYQKIITLESHYEIGGLGSFVAETIASQHINCQLQVMGVKSTLDLPTGNNQFMLSQQKISSHDLITAIKKIL